MSSEAMRRNPKYGGYRKTRNLEKHNYTIFRILRMCMGWNLQQMAEKCKLSAIYLNELELGKKTNPSDKVIEQIAQVCGLDTDSLKFLISRQSNISNEIYRQKMIKAIEALATEYEESEIIPEVNEKPELKSVSANDETMDS